jgi:hypothetical protein
MGIWREQGGGIRGVHGVRGLSGRLACQAIVLQRRAATA